MNLLINPGGESNPPPPTLTGGALRSAGGYEGSWHYDLLGSKQTVLGVPVTVASAAEWTGLSLTPGTSYTVALYVNQAGATAAANLIVDVDDGGGSYATLDSLTGDGSSGYALWAVGSFTAAGSTGRFRVRVPAPAANGTTIYAIDALRLEETDNVAILNTIRTALASDLAQITTGNGYSLTVAQVYTEPKRVAEMLKPGIYIAPDESTEAEIDTLTNRIGAAVQTYTVVIVANTRTPNATMDNFSDDVRNAVERSTGALLTTSGVYNVVVSEIGSVLVDADTAQDDYLRVIKLTIEYEYTRGSA